MCPPSTAPAQSLHPAACRKIGSCRIFAASCPGTCRSCAALTTDDVVAIDAAERQALPLRPPPSATRLPFTNMCLRTTGRVVDNKYRIPRGDSYTLFFTSCESVYGFSPGGGGHK